MSATTTAPRPRLDGLLFAVLAAATIGCAAFAGYVDLHNTDVQASIIAITGASFALTVLFRNGWVGGVLVGFGVPLAHAYARLTGMALPYPMPHPWSTLLALGPAVAGVVVGLAVRTGVAQARH